MKKTAAPRPIERIGKVSDASVFKGTGRHWHEWIPILDQISAHTLKHGEITAYLKTKHKLTPWWQQGVAMGFEIHRGLRQEGRDAKGNLSITVTKSLAIGAKEAWSRLVSEAGQAIWLRPLFEVSLKPGAPFETEDGYFGEVRTMLQGRRLRLSWQSPDWDRKTVLQILVVDRAQSRARLKLKPVDSKSKTILAFTHEGVRDARIEARLRRRWREAADALAK